MTWTRPAVAAVLIGAALLSVMGVLGAARGIAHTPHGDKIKRGSCTVKMKQPRIKFENGGYRPYGRARIRRGCGDRRIDVYLAQIGGEFTTCCRHGYVTSSPMTALSQGRVGYNCDGDRRTFATYVKVGPRGNTGGGATDRVLGHRHHETKTVIC